MARRRLTAVHDAAPRAHVLSNGRYAALISEAGAGVSTRGEVAVNAWAGDRTADADGVFFYLRDRHDGSVWSAGFQPTAAVPERYGARFEPGRVTIERADRGIETRMVCAVDPSRDAEIRRLTIVNRSARRRTVEVTAYAEVVLQSLAGHFGHPAFSKLFVQTEFVPRERAVVAARRPRGHGEKPPWLAATLSGPGALEHETDRARFVGRGRTLRLPAALLGSERLSGTSGSVLDPVIALRRVVALAPGASATLDLVIAIGDDRDGTLAALRALRMPRAAGVAIAAARARELAVRRRLGLSAARAESLQRIAGAMRYRDPAVRSDGTVLRRCLPGFADFGAVGLRPWALHAIARMSGRLDTRRLRELVAAQAYWRVCGLAVDLLLVGERAEALAAAADDERRRVDDADAVIAVRTPSAIGRAALDRLRAAADLAIEGALPDLPDRAFHVASARATRYRPAPIAAGDASSAGEPLALDNGYGGFAEDGRDYVIRVGPEPGDRPPAPWANVLANERFGCLVTESGAANTWSANSRQNRLTPWSNDPVGDPYGEALYLRDEDDGVVASPLPGPAPSGAVFEVRHGPARSLWRHRSLGLAQEVLTFVPRHDPVKLTVVTLRNLEARPRRLSLVSYARLVLGVLPGPTVVTEIDAGGELILARSPFRDEAPGGVTFAAAIVPRGARTRLASDRAAFLGRNGSTAAPAGVLDPPAGSERGAAGHDACAVLDVSLALAPNEVVECAFLLGEAPTESAARSIVARLRRPGAWQRSLEEIRSFWDEIDGALEVRTPSPGLDRMMNGWLLHQLVSCRLWGRTAFYQSGGAFGFRDQLQDSAALVYARPDLFREQILLHASHQFPEGDVLHWWHTPSGRGTRTRCSDDLLWLPYLATFYARATGDWSVFDAPAGFVSARLLVPGEDETFLQPEPLRRSADVYAHCCLAIDRSLARGVHGLPLIGTCDWNDGMNRVGREGRGESVWLAFFLAVTLEAMAPLCERRGDAARAERYRRHRAELAAAVESDAWDGAWYRRGYYDDGTPLGSAQSSECRIDALAQSWAVISRLAREDRAREAMTAAGRELVREDDRLIRLLTPPFDHAPEDPGYIKGYVPGIRENGGQYTHGALWVVRAFAEIGERERATRLLEMLTPSAHAATRHRADVYKVEPYVVAADVYGAPPHIGRGGWTWYTGSAAWMYRVALESVLGFTLEDGVRARVSPRVPDAWPGFSIAYRAPGGRSRYAVEVENPSGSAAHVAAVDAGGLECGIDERGAWFALADDGELHRVRVTLGAEPGTVRPSDANR